MSKQLTPAELAKLVTDLLVNPQELGELDSPEKFSAFMTDVASLICDHCGGQVARAADNDADQWLIGIVGNESSPPDGGVWKDFDPEGELFNEPLSQGGPCPALMNGHWYFGDDGRSHYIIPDERHGLTETYGPDGDMLDNLNALYRDLDTGKADWFDAVDRESIAKRFDLYAVPDWQKRYEPLTDSYYTV